MILQNRPELMVNFVGIGLRQPHYFQIQSESPAIDWLEVHSENFFRSHSALNTLLTIREKYPISLHGVGLSLGSATPPSIQHLKRLKNLMNDVQPFLISEHLSWSNVTDSYLPDLLPLPYTEEALVIFCENIITAQNFLNCELLIENPSTYLEYQHSTIAEVEFITAVAKTTNAKILLDINNIYVSCLNHEWDPYIYLNTIPVEYVKEIHLAGHSIQNLTAKTIKIDTHDNPVCEDVWKLFAYAVKRFKYVPTLIEWDANIPELNILLAEAHKAKTIMETINNSHANSRENTTSLA